MAVSKVEVVVTCSNRKSLPTDGLRARALGRGTVEERARQWLDWIATSSSATRTARDLYQGDHWARARALDRDRALSTRVWVASAGYGLVHIDDPLQAYSATLSRGHQDSVANSEAEAQVWWREVNSRRRCRENGPSSLEQLGQMTDSVVLVVASATYVGAMRKDLKACLGALGDEGRLWILSAGCKPSGRLSKCFLPCDARLQRKVGGARQSLNIRAASLLLSWMASRSVETIDEAKAQLSKELSHLGPVENHNRTKLSDNEVRAFIRGNPNRSATYLLRALRAGGRACEQARFRRLHSLERGLT